MISAVIILLISTAVWGRGVIFFNCKIFEESNCQCHNDKQTKAISFLSSYRHLRSTVLTCCEPIIFSRNVLELLFYVSIL